MRILSEQRVLRRDRVPAGWIDSTFQQRKAHVERLLEGLEHRDAEFRFTNARRLLYVLQGAGIHRVRTGNA